MVKISPRGRIQAQQISRQQELTKGTQVKQQIGLVPTRQEVIRRRPTIVPPTEEQIQASIESARQAQLQKDVSEINKIISDKELTVKQLEEAVRRANAAGRNTDELERTLSFERRFLFEFKQAKINVQKGFTLQSSLQQAEQKASGFQERTELRIATGTPSQQEQIQVASLRDKFTKGEISESEFERRVEKLTGQLPLISGRETIEPTELDPRMEVDVIRVAPTEPLEELRSATENIIAPTTSTAIQDFNKQVTIPQTDTSSFVTPLDTSKDRFTLSSGEAFKLTAKDIGFNLLNFLKGSPEEFRDIGRFPSLTPLTGSSVLQFDIQPTNILQRGTQITDPTLLPTAFQPTKGLTGFEAAERGFIIPNINVPTGTLALEKTKAGAETAAVIGVSFTGPTGLALSSAFIGGKGFLEAESAQQQFKLAKRFEAEEKPFLASEARARGAAQLGVGGLQLGVGLLGASASLRGIETQIDLARLEQLQAKPFKVTGVQIQGKGDSQISIVKGSRSVRSARQDITVKLPSFAREGKTIFGQTETGIPVPIQTTTEGFSVTGGEIGLETRLFSFGKERFFRDTKLFGLQATGISEGGAISFRGTPVTDKGITIGRGTGIVFEKPLGKLDFKIKTKLGPKGSPLKTRLGSEVESVRLDFRVPPVDKTLTEFKFAGVVKEQDNFITFVSGKPTKARFFTEPKQFEISSGGDVTTTLRLTGRKTALFKPGVFGRVFKVRPETTGTGNILIQSGRSTTVPRTILSSQQKASLTAIGTPTTIVSTKGIENIVTQLPRGSLELGTTAVTGASVLETKQRTQTLFKPSIRFKQDTKVKTDVVSIPKSRQVPRTRTKTKTGVTSAQVPKVASLVRPSQAVTTAQIPRLQTKLQQQQITSLVSLSPPSTTPALLTTFSPAFGFGFGLPKKGRRIKSTIRRRKGIGLSLARKPSLVALGTGIFARSPARGEFSGLVIRPIIERPKKKKAKKKKKKKKNPAGFIIGI